MNFKCIHKIAVIQEKFLVHFNLLQGPDTKHLGPDPACGLCIAEL